MKRMELDYLRKQTPMQFWVGLLIVLISLLVIFKLSYEFKSMSYEIDSLEDLSTKLKKKLHTKNNESRQHPIDIKKQNQQTAIAKAIAQKVAIPWTSLFNVIEESNTENIALLAIEPNVNKRLIQLTGEAKTFSSMVEYMKKLQQSDQVKDVFIKHHEVVITDPDKPVKFELEVSWALR